MSILHLSNCAVLTFKKSDKQKKKSYTHFSFLTFTYVHSYVGDFICFTGRFYRAYAWRVRGRKSVHGRRFPLNVGELTALPYSFAF